ncbi:hypothetical protein SERP0023 [Staphylococcus epidermidis RP62A]|uniref:Uncharacterized protein n=1 Tax=Staphylococcus epidermidis (strain ATCC 35984 / DSM 28319 / BCRC 17069 / CCUG 31568 / BM 3577 / RP62A) TaxID=176279 RepID=Q5HS16_STAEQ|nr:hypothetical protein SERP0023 [Staphylococcus epidermidis RP62A]EON84468.1 hypothetical protein H701_00440 [Staphylococcus epidermidis 528m]
MRYAFIALERLILVLEEVEPLDAEAALLLELELAELELLVPPDVVA